MYDAENVEFKFSRLRRHLKINNAKKEAQHEIEFVISKSK